MIIFIVGTLLLVLKSVLLNSSIGLEINIHSIVCAFVASCLLMCPIINKKNKFSYIYLNVVYAIITFIIYANYLYYSYSTNFISFYQISNLQYSKEIGSGLLVLINAKNLLAFWSMNIVVAILSVIIYRKTSKKKLENSLKSEDVQKKLKSNKDKVNSIIKKYELISKNKFFKMINHFVTEYYSVILIIAIIITNILLVVKDSDLIYESKSYNKSLIVQGTSIYYYHYEDAKDYFSSLFVKEKFDNEKLKEAYQKNIANKKETKYNGIAKNENVIILQLESLNEYVINKKVNGKEITPNLNKFFNENIYCEDMYNQGLGTTADSEFEMENSMYPLENGYVFQKYYNNTWFDIYTSLKKEGYYTSFMHPNTSTFWNRNEVYNNGYHIDEYDDINKFPDIERAGEFYSDEGFLDEAVNIMSSYEGNFCTTLVSVTTHIPFYLDGVSNLENKVTLTSEDLSEYEDGTFINYLISCNFIDYAFGKFLKGLESTGLLENSILIVYGDHGSGLSNTEDIARLYKENGAEYTEFRQTTKDIHIPYGMKVSTIKESIKIEKTMSKIDIKPTILDLLGYEDNFSLGESIFSGKDYSFIKGLGYITSQNYQFNGNYYNRNTMQKIEENDELKKLSEKMEREIYLSDAIIKNNLLAK